MQLIDFSLNLFDKRDSGTDFFGDDCHRCPSGRPSSRGRPWLWGAGRSVAAGGRHRERGVRPVRGGDRRLVVLRWRLVEHRQKFMCLGCRNLLHFKSKCCLKPRVLETWGRPQHRSPSRRKSWGWGRRGSSERTAGIGEDRTLDEVS